MSGFSNPIAGYGGALTIPAIKSPNFSNDPGPAWSFGVSGTPSANNFFTVFTSQGAQISVGDVFTDTKNPGSMFRVTFISSPAFGFVNVFFTPNATHVMSGDTVTQLLQSGWAIMKNGDAFFFNIVASGSITAESVQIEGSQGDVLVYSGAPAAGDLLAALTGATGNDGVGNTWPAGFTLFGTTFQTEQTPGQVRTKIDQFGNFLVFNQFGALIFLIAPGGAGWFLYDDTGSATQGALFQSSATVAGTDQFGTAYVAGTQVHGSNGQSISQAINAGNPVASFYSGTAEEEEPGFLATNIDNIGLVNEFLAFFAVSPRVTGFDDYVFLSLLSSPKDGSNFAGGELAYVDRAAVQHPAVQWGEGGLLLGPCNDISAIQPGSALVAEPWHRVGSAGEPAFGTGWSNRAAGFVGLAFKKLASPPDSVMIRGWVTPAATGDLTLFTLPVGYRPIGSQTALVWAVTGASVVQFNIGINGVVGAAGTLPNTGNYYIDCIISLDQ